MWNTPRLGRGVFANDKDQAERKSEKPRAMLQE